jgi:hypothetical protein
MTRDANRIEILIKDLESRYGYTDPVVLELRALSLRVHNDDTNDSINPSDRSQKYPFHAPGRKNNTQ